MATSYDSSRSWFCVLNNPENVYENLSDPKDIAKQALDDWIKDKPTRSGAIAYCISANGLKHLHMVLEDSSKARFSAIKKTYPKAHIEPTMGSKEQAEDYIHKRGEWEEKGEQVIFITQHGEIKGAQGQRKDLEILEELLERGYNPRQIMDMNLSYRRYDKLLKGAFFAKKRRETPFKRDINVVWHVGESHTGKSYTAQKLIEKYGDDSVYFMSDYKDGGLDNYMGESILFMDEFRGQLRYSTLLSMLGGYRVEIHSRFQNVMSLWTEVHIATVLPPDLVYKDMVTMNKDVDSIKQLMVRINEIRYHYKLHGEYKEISILGSEYTTYEALQRKAGFVDADLENVPFEQK